MFDEHEIEYVGALAAGEIPGPPVFGEHELQYVEEIAAQREHLLQYHDVELAVPDEHELQVVDKELAAREAAEMQQPHPPPRPRSECINNGTVLIQIREDVVSLEGLRAACEEIQRHVGVHFQDEFIHNEADAMWAHIKNVPANICAKRKRACRDLTVGVAGLESPNLN